MSGYPTSNALVPGDRPSEAKHPKVYQIDFTAVAAGKRIASTKRRVRWRFGFANPEALAAGLTGTECRGEEHDITLVWSLTSGKRLILADGQEVHYSSSRGGVLDFSWTMRGNHVLKIVAHSAPPLSPTPGFRQYDFFVDGQSFFSFPKVFRLGLAPGDPRGSGPQPRFNASPAPSGGASVRSVGGELVSIEVPHNHDEEIAYLQEAIKNSLLESSAKGNMSQDGKDLLLDFFDDNTTVTTAPPAITAQPHGFADYGQSYGAPAAPAFASPPQYGAPAPVAPAYSNYTFPPAPAAPPYGAAPSYPQQPSYGGPALLALPAPPQSFAAAPAPPSADPWGSQPSSATTNSWNAPDPVAQSTSWGAPAPSASWNAPPAPSTPSFAAAPNPWDAQAPADAAAAYGFASPQFAAPPSAVEYSNSAPLATPSSVGFASPQSNGITPHAYTDNTNFATPAFQYDSQPFQSSPAGPALYAADPVAPPASAAADPAAFSMSTLSGQNEVPTPSNSNVSLADQAYAKYASLGEFDLVSKKEPARENPFAAAPIGSTMSLADMKANLSKPETKKPVMNSSATIASQAGSLVLHGTQQGNNWGQDVRQPIYGQRPAAQTLQPSTFGQQPAAFGQYPPSFGHQPPVPVQQASVYGQSSTLYGQAPPTQSQAPPFGQPYSQAPAAQNPFGGF